MKILMVTPMLPRPQAAGALPIVMHGQLNELAARHEVTLASFIGPDAGDWAQVESLRASGIAVHAIWRPQPSRARQLRRRLRWLVSRDPYRAIWFWEAEMQRLLDRLLATTSFDMVQVEDVGMGAYRYRTMAATVLTEMEVRQTWPTDRYDEWRSRWVRQVLSWSEWRRWQQFQPAVWRRFDRIQVFTARDAGALCAMAPEVARRVRVNPFGVEIPEQIDSSHEQPDSLLFVGSFLHPPNVEAAIWLANEIMPLLRARRPGASLTLVGSYPSGAVRALASDAVVLAGDAPCVEAFLERAAVFVAPLRTGGGMRLKVLQALAAGKPVVTTPLGAEGLLVGDQPPLAIAEDADAFACAIAALLADDQVRRDMGRRARTFAAKQHSWHAYGKRLETIYAELRPLEVAV